MVLFKRFFISTWASLVIFLFASYKLVESIILSDNHRKTLKFAWQSLMSSDQLTENLTLTLFLINAAVILLVFFLVRLFISLEVFDRSNQYYDYYLSPLKTPMRLFEWFLRFSVVMYLLIGINSYTPFLKAINQVLEWLGLNLPSYNTSGVDFYLVEAPIILFEICEVILYVIGFYILMLSWDFFLLVSLLISDKRKRNLQTVIKIWKRFMSNHVVGFILWTMMLILFYSKYFMKPMYFVLFLFCILVINLYFFLCSTWCVFREFGQLHFEIRNDLPVR